MDHFQTLLQRSTNLLHSVDGVDWEQIAIEDSSPECPTSSAANEGDGDEIMVENRVEDDNFSDEDSDDGLIMFGGLCSDSEDEGATENVHLEEEEGADEDEDEEDDALLKRASSVHAALLLLLPPALVDDDGRAADGELMARQLVSAVLAKASGSEREDGCSSSSFSADEAWTESLVSLLSFAILSSSLERRPKKTIRKERWRRACLTNSLLAVQFLLHLMRSNEASASPLNEWNVVILPLIFGNPGMTSISESSAFLLNDALCGALLNLSSFSSGNHNICHVKATADLCLNALDHFASSKVVPLRSKKIVVVCQVLIRFQDNVSRRILKGEEVEIARDAIHHATLTILRGICYEVIPAYGKDNEDDVTAYRPPMLSLESLRSITGLLLPNLLDAENNSKNSEGRDVGETEANKRAIELWNEMLLLLYPYSDSFVDESEENEHRFQGEKRRCCKNWNSVAPMAATAILCILFPAFRKMDLPIDAVASTKKRCRPIYQQSVWNLIRDCLARCGDSNTVGDGGCGSGRGSSLLSREPRNGESNNEGLGNLGDYDVASMDQLLRRRSATLLRLMVEYERERTLRDGTRNNGKGKNGRRRQQQQSGNASCGDSRRRLDLWTKYVLCFEMLEMEMELHLVEQVWQTVKEMTSEIASIEVLNDTKESGSRQLPSLAWDDIGSLLCRVLLSDAPTMRKLGAYRFLSGHTGVDVTVPKEKSADDPPKTNDIFMNQPKSKGRIKQTSGGALAPVQLAPLSCVSVTFVMDVMRAYDSIIATKVGINMQVEEEGQQISASISDLLSGFLSNYTITLALDGIRLSEFVNKVFGPELIQSHKSRSVVLFYHSVATALDTITSNGERHLLEIDPENIQSMIRSMRATFSSGGAPLTLQTKLKLDLALVLKNSIPWTKVDASLVLQVLALYPPPEELTNEAEGRSQTKARLAIRSWLLHLGDGKWVKNAASACASAFVLGQLIPFSEIDVFSGVNTAEREIGMAICTLCSLSGVGSELLWPAVFRGLSSEVSGAAPPTPGFFKANRSMILLEFGCKEGVLSGLGNGDLLLDDSKKYMIPPPPNIESLLSNAVQFILSQVMSLSKTLFYTKRGEGTVGGSTRSSTSSTSSSYVGILINQLSVLHLAYPSSVLLSDAVNHMLEDVNHRSKTNDENVVKYLTLSYAALSCGATFTGGGKLMKLLNTCQTILGAELIVPPGIKKEARQACRSIFQYAQWGSLSLIIPKITKEAEAYNPEVEVVYQAILDFAKSSVDATPIIALPPLFECVLGAGMHVVKFDGQRTPLLSSLQTIIETLFAVLNEETSSSNWTHMLNNMSRLIFQGKLLLDEYQCSYANDNRGPIPIMQAFEKLLHIGGTTKPYIYKTVVSQISVAWLGPEHPEGDVGLCAIPYRRHIVSLLVFKECRFDENAAKEVSNEKWDVLPEGTDSSSTTRGFVLSFLSKLPPPEDMSDVVLEELIYFVMRELIDISCTKPARGKAFISGSEEYARITRAWQALCLLSRFVTEEISKEVADRVFKAMAFNLHGQLRYFIEVFTIQCTRKHPSIFGQMYIREVSRTDLSLQHVSSLMIIGGNLTVGRYSSDFFNSSTDPKVKAVLCGVLPWLSSTQGFSRAIAQLLCHELIPLVVDVGANGALVSREQRDGNKEEIKDDEVLCSIYSFLKENSDMSRLRKKQQVFFDAYDVDSVCTFEGLLSIPVDEGEEANPMHMVDAIKNCLAEVYKDAHDDDAPVWKQMEDLLMEADRVNQNEASNDDSGEVQNENELVNFQRKILPIDALDLGIHSYEEQKLLNAAGKKKQHLIVCASLIEKVPNLAGLARTCEIFSARTLVVPNLFVKKQDDFKSISASANDWIHMEECKEDSLLSWLYKKRSEGYAIVGLEQTASSKCLTKMQFAEKTVLLLGKEKEGIPIEFLSAVDQCIEIPQLGIIRSLNVHVSGAISIWEYTKQMMQKKNAT